MCWCVFFIWEGWGFKTSFWCVYGCIHVCVRNGIFLHFAIDEYHIIVCITSNLKKAYGKWDLWLGVYASPWAYRPRWTVLQKQIPCNITWSEFCPIIIALHTIIDKYDVDLCCCVVDSYVLHTSIDIYSVDHCWCVVDSYVLHTIIDKYDVDLCCCVVDSYVLHTTIDIYNVDHCYVL